jgi:hypothetical protein
MRAGFSYGAVGHLRPVGAMALTVMLLIGGGTYLGVTDWNQPAPAPPAQTAVVHDLQLLDSNQQILDQLESMSGNQADGD